MKEYEKQLEEANESLQRKVEALETRLSWEEKTKDLRTLAVEYHKMDKEIYDVNMTKIVDGFLSLDVNCIIDMWKKGFRINTVVGKKNDDGNFFCGKRYSVYIAGPFNNNRIGYDSEHMFAMNLEVLRSTWSPLIHDQCSIVIEHNRVCDFSGVIAQSTHTLDKKYSKQIVDFHKKIDICKSFMNNLITSNLYVKRDTFKFPWTDIPGTSQCG